jgi:hypothetical protein
LHLKKLTKDYEVRKNGRKIQNGIKKLCFHIFSGNQNGGLVQDGVIFGKKNRIFLGEFGQSKLSFFPSVKASL